MSSLIQFLSADRNSVYREAMMRHQLLHDIHLTFARHRQRIQIYEPEVDALGYDIILDDLIRTHRIQLKTTLATSTTAKWDIHKILLRPDLNHLNRLPFSSDSGGSGYMGGVILTSAHIEGDRVHYRYSYTDVLVVCAIVAGICPPATGAQRESVRKIYNELTKPDYRPAKIAIRMPCFWTFRSLRPVLALAGFDMGYEGYPRHALMEAVGRPERVLNEGGVDRKESLVKNACRTIAEMMKQDADTSLSNQRSF